MFEDGEVCDQQCINIEGKNKCSCAPGYERLNNRCFGINSKSSLVAVFHDRCRKIFNFTAPASEPTLLFVLSSKNIYKITLPSERKSSVAEDFAPVAITQGLKLNAPISMEINFLNHSVCVLEDFEINCYNPSNFAEKWKLPNPDFLPAFECKFQDISFI